MGTAGVLVWLLALLFLLARSPCSGQDPTLNLILITPSRDAHRAQGGVEAGLVLQEVRGGRYACSSRLGATPSMPPGDTAGDDGGSGSSRCRVEMLEAAQLALQRVNGNGSVLRHYQLTMTSLQTEVMMHQLCL